MYLYISLCYLILFFGFLLFSLFFPELSRSFFCCLVCCSSFVHSSTKVFFGHLTYTAKPFYLIFAILSLIGSIFSCCLKIIFYFIEFVFGGLLLLYQLFLHSSTSFFSRHFFSLSQIFFSFLYSFI